MNPRGIVFTAVLAVVTQTAQAFVDPPLLVPSHPLAGQLVSINVTAGGCDAFPAGEPPTITRSGNSIRILLQSVSTINPTCFLPSLTSTFAIGAFDIGSYSVQVDRTFLGSNGPTAETIGVLPFAVVSVIPNTPASGTWSLALLLSAILCVAAYRISSLKHD